MANHDDTIELIIQDFKQRRWNTNPYARALELVISHPEQIESLIEAALDELDESVTSINEAMSFIEKDAFSRLTNKALNLLEKAPNHTHAMAESVIEHCSFQFPELLHPHLSRIFRLAPNANSYTECSPWRNSGLTHFEQLRSTLIDQTQSPEDREKAWRCLLETREAEALHCAVQYAKQLSLTSPDDYLLEVGFCLEDKTLRPLYPQTSFHLVFDEAYPLDRSPSRKLHPTWHLTSAAPIQAEFGGQGTNGCPACDGQLDQLLALQTIPEELGITQLSRLELACCLSCLDEHAPLFYRHNELGIPMSFAHDQPNAARRFAANTLQASTIQLVKTPARWQWQDWGHSNGRENLNRLGGHPSWVQSAEYPACPQCHKTMTFLLQLDSEFPLQDDNGRSWYWGSGGLGYGYWCDDCHISSYSWQCT